MPEVCRREACRREAKHGGPGGGAQHRRDGRSPVGLDFLSDLTRKQIDALSQERLDKFHERAAQQAGACEAVGRAPADEDPSGQPAVARGRPSMVVGAGQWWTKRSLHPTHRARRHRPGGPESPPRRDARRPERSKRQAGTRPAGIEHVSVWEVTPCE
jgi:hypothetical protein